MRYAASPGDNVARNAIEWIPRPCDPPAWETVRLSMTELRPLLHFQTNPSDAIIMA